MFNDYGSIYNCEGELYPRSWGLLCIFFIASFLLYTNIGLNRSKHLKIFCPIIINLIVFVALLNSFIFKPLPGIFVFLVNVIGMTMVDKSI